MSAKGLFTRLKLRNLLRRNGSRLLDTDITSVSYPTKFLRDFKQYQTSPSSLLNILIPLKLATAFFSHLQRSTSSIYSRIATTKKLLVDPKVKYNISRVSIY